jgi:hypothetical protein
VNVTKLKSKGKASPEDINIMMEELLDYREDDQLSKWQRGFYDNIRANLEHGRDLSELQILKLREMYEEHCQ